MIEKERIGEARRNVRIREKRKILLMSLEQVFYADLLNSERLRLSEITPFVRSTLGLNHFNLKKNDEGVAVFRKQPGFISYRLMRASSDVTVAVAEWKSEKLGEVGAENYRGWMKENGIWNKLVLQTYDGEVVASSC